MKKHNDNHIVSVIIPTVRKDTLSLTQEALKNQTRKPDEVITIVDKNRQGASWARNQGISQARGDLIAFIDDDCIPDEDWLEYFIDKFDKYQADGIGGNYKEIDPLLDDIRKRRKFPQKVSEDNMECVGIGGNVVYKRKILDALYRQYGYYFDEKILTSQDCEISWRLQKIGAKLIYVPLEVTHLKRMKPLTFLKFQFGRGTGIANLYKVSCKEKESSVYFHKSLLWREKKDSKKPNWLKIIFIKLIGPFDVKSFRNYRNFILFWLGEKFQGMGFLWKIFLYRIGKE